MNLIRNSQGSIGNLRQRPGLLALAGYGLLAALFYAPLLLGLQTFEPGDFTDHFLPFNLFLRSEWLAGRLPLWNPYTYAGHPFLADVQAAIFYPLSNLLLLFTTPWGSDAARLYWLQVEAIIQTALAGFFLYLLLRDLLGPDYVSPAGGRDTQTVTRPPAGRHVAAFLAGCVFAFSGYLTGYPPLQLAVLRTAIWLPLVLWLLLRAFQQPQLWRWWIGAALAYAVAFLAGHPQTFLHLSYAVAAWILLLLWVTRRSASTEQNERTSTERSERNRGSLRPQMRGVAAFYGLSLALSAAQWLPSAEFTGLSVRAGVDYDYLSGGFPLADTWQLLLPGLLTYFSPLYVGLIGLALALIAVLTPFEPQTSGSGLRVRDRGPSRTAFVAYFALLALAALLVSYGRNGFLYPLVYRWLPGWDLFRGQERAAYLVAFGLSALAGLGAAALPGLSARRRRLLAAGGAAAVVAGILVFYLIRQQPGLTDATPQEFVFAAGLALSLIIAFAGLLWPAGWSGRRSTLLVFLLLANLFLANFGAITVERSPAEATALPPEALAVRDAVAEQSAANPGAGLPGRVYNEYRISDDYGMRVGVEEVWGSSPLRLEAYAALFDEFPQDRMWRLLGVAHVLTWQQQLFRPSQLLGQWPGKAGDTTYLHRLEESAPRAWVAGRLRIAGDDEARNLLADGSFDLENTALLAPGSASGCREADSWLPAAFPSDGLFAAPGNNSIRLERLAPNHLRVDIESERGGLLLVSENWLPGWQAMLTRPDQPGGCLPVLRADLTLLGLPAPAGASSIELVYKPASVWVGLSISGLALLVLAGAGLWRWRRRRTDSPGPAAEPPAAHQAPPSTSQDCQSSARTRLHWALAAILALGFALRVYRLDFQELRGDEVFGYFFSLPSLAEIVRSTLSLREPHPVASYFLQKGWLGLAGHSEFALRFTSAWFGALAVALIYRLGRRLRLGAATATLAAGLLAVSPYAIWHSQDARMYTISLALTLASTILALEALARRRRAWWLAYVIVSWLALQTHYFAVFVILAQNAAVLVLALTGADRRRRLRGWLPGQVLLVMLYLPWLIVAAETLTAYRGNGDSPGFAAMLVRAASVFAVGETIPPEQRLGIALLAGLLLLIGAMRLSRVGSTGRQALLWLGLYLAAPLLATWFSALSRPIFNERYLIAAAPPFFLLAAAAVLGAPGAARTGSTAPKPRDQIAGLAGWAAAALLALLLFNSATSFIRYHTDPAYSKTRGWRELAAVLERLSSGLPPEQVRLAQNFPDPTLWYYYAGPVDHLVLPPAAHDAGRTAQEVQALVDGGVQRVILPLQPAGNWDDADIAATALAQPYAVLAETKVGNWPVRIYSRPPDAWTRQDVRFANGLVLAESAVPVRTVQPGDVLPVYLRWLGAADLLNGAEKLTLQLLDESGRLAAQSDQPFGQAQLQATETPYPLQLPLMMAPGSYRLILALYDPGQDGAPRLLSVSGADFVELDILNFD